LPHGESMHVVEQVMGLTTGAAVKCIDLSGDFRLADASTYESWYGKPHTAEMLLKEAVYGLPEVFGKQIGDATLIANPGCYPTCVILGAAPLLASGLGFSENVIADCLSGISGAGRTATQETHYCAADESVSTYKAGGIHQHIPEMELYLGLAAKQEVALTFTPHLAPFSRGIYGTIYVDIKDSATVGAIRAAYEEFYEDSYFVKVMPAGEYPRLKSVCGSNFCHIGIAADERTGKAIIVSAIDNLVKGASGQAIQNMNIMFDLPEETGLKQVGLWP